MVFVAGIVALVVVLFLLSAMHTGFAEQVATSDKHRQADSAGPERWRHRQPDRRVDRPAIR